MRLKDVGRLREAWAGNDNASYASLADILIERAERETGRPQRMGVACFELFLQVLRDGHEFRAPRGLWRPVHASLAPDEQALH